MNPADLQAAWARWLIDALVASGVRRVVVSPGSRSTPLVLAIAAAEARGALGCTVAADERTAGFFALGQARATGEPSLLVCTSGTAGSHYYPAVIEASRARHPMIVLTADRPFELRGRGAAQTIDQAGMFGRFVRASIEVGPPDPDERAVDGLLHTAWLAAHHARWPKAGPVHLNLGLRKPLEPAGGSAAPGLALLERRVETTLDRSFPPMAGPTGRADPGVLDAAAEAILGARRGILVLGPASVADAVPADALQAFVTAAGFPVLAEATSQHRFGSASFETVCDTAEPLFASDAFLADLAPDLVVQVGEAPIGRALGAWIPASGVKRIVIASHAEAEAFNQAALVIVGQPGGALEDLASRVSGPGAAESGWNDRVVNAVEMARDVVDAELEATPAGSLDQGGAIRLALAAVPRGGQLIVGNSMPVRDVDLYCPTAVRGIRVLSQRGAAGIDGLVSGAIGSAAAAARPSVLLLGDVSFQHDVGGLALHPAASDAGVPVAVVVIQNGGGRLFDLLPVRGRDDFAASFERYFLTPAPISVEGAALSFGVRAHRATDTGALAAALSEALAEPGVTVIEAVVDGPGSSAAVTRIAREVDARL